MRPWVIVGVEPGQRRRGALPFLLGLCALLLTGCPSALSSLRHRSEIDTEVGRFQVEYSDSDTGSKDQIAHAVKSAGDKLDRWGQLKEPISVWVMPTHELLEKAVNREGYDWLRAWARFDEVFIQSPRTWSIFGASQADVDELVLHELTHCVMYQQAASRTDWTRKEIPLWFREGMASFNAEQGYRWPTLEELAGYYGSHPTHDPVGNPDGLYQGQSEIVYGAAHHAFTFLMRRYGGERVKFLLEAMSRGAAFPEAFETTLSLSTAQFTEDFKRYVRLRGFRGGRVRVGGALRLPGRERGREVAPFEEVADPGPLRFPEANLCFYR